MARENRDMQSFNKLSPKEQLAAVINFIKTFPRDRQEDMVREILVNTTDQEQMLKELEAEYGQNR